MVNDRVVENGFFDNLAIYLYFHWHQVYCDIQKVYENAIFRLGFLPVVTGHGVAYSAMRPIGLP
jgi:hypothetical protein